MLWLGAQDRRLCGDTSTTSIHSSYKDISARHDAVLCGWLIYIKHGSKFNKNTRTIADDRCVGVVSLCVCGLDPTGILAMYMRYVAVDRFRDVGRVDGLRAITVFIRVCQTE